MKRLLRGLSLLAAAAVLTPILPAPPVAIAAGAAPAPTSLLRSRSFQVAGIAMDGSRVAIASRALLTVYPPSGRPYRTFCDRVDLASVAGGPLVRLSIRSRGTYCSGGQFGGAPGSFLALAGSRAYWTYAPQGNNLYQSLYTAAPGSAQRLLTTPFPGGADHQLGPFLGPIAASGSSLAYSTYRRTSAGVPYGATLTLRGANVALPAPGGIVASVDSGRAAVLLVDGRVAIVQHGAPAKVVGGGHGTVRGAALAGRWLVVLAANRLWVYDAGSGGFHASYPAVGATRVDLYAGIAVLTTRLKLVAVRVTNGHRRVVSTLGRGRAFVRGAEVEAGGIVWATQPARAPLNGLNVVYRLPLPAIR